MSARSPVASPPSSRARAGHNSDPSSADKRKAFGVYYTPARLAGLLASWAIEHQPKRLLEPSYGEGVFLREIDAKMRERGVRDPSHRLYGVELDPAGPAHLRESGLRLPEGHLRSGDLLSFDPISLGGHFNAIVGNPPYIRHHLLDEKLIARGRKSAKLLGISLNGRSDAWVYFCAHLVTFLAEGGRMALVLPGSVLQADYAKPLLKALAREEGEVQLVQIGERLFGPVQERTVLLLIDRSRPSGEAVIHRRIANLKGLGAALKRRPRARSKVAPDRKDQRRSWRLSAKEEAAWEAACATKGVIRLGEVAKVRIGVVTGANSFFVRSKAEADALGKRVQSAPIVPRGAWLAAPRWSAAAQRKAAEAPSRLLLFPASESGLSGQACDEIAKGEREGLHERHHCAKREPWYRITDSEVPALFLPYMASRPPRLVLNDAKATCTNAIHRVWLQPGAALSAEALAVASWTTLYRVSAELVGRSYGGGVLKLEPSGAMALRIASLEDPELIAEIEAVHRSVGLEGARDLADRRILIEGLGMGVASVKLLAAAAERLESLRRA